MSAHDWPANSGRRRTQTVVTRIAHQVSTRQVQFLFAGSVLCAAALLARRLGQGWFENDDGSLAHSAERVLAGELPHRDFADLYTGLLSFLNAAVFTVAGEDIFNLRLPLFILFLAFAGCFFALARRLVSPLWAFAATLFAIAWSVPVYPAPIASWYVLFLSTFGMYAVVRFFETGRQRWLFAAGAFGGIAIGVKVAGVWYVAAVVLALLAGRMLDDREIPSSPRTSRRYAAIVTSFVLLILSVVIAVLSRRLGAGEVVGLLLPVTALCCAVAILGWRVSLDSSRKQGAEVAGEITVFLAGVGVPIALLVAPYALTGSVGDLVEGVLITPQSRFEFASWSMPHAATLRWAVPVVALFLVRSQLTEWRRQRLDVAAGFVVVLVVATAADERSYSAIWNTARALVPVVVVLGAFAILRRGEAPARLRSPVMGLVVLVGGFSTLLQFPFAGPVYFCYVAPLVLLAAIASMRRFGLADGLLPGVVLIALVVFGVRQLDRQSLFSLGYVYRVDPQVAIIDGDRASIRALPEVKREYDKVRELVAQHRTIGQPIFAGPDAPDIYFLTDSQNPTPSILDFLDTSGVTRGNELVRLLVEKDVRIVVLNHEPRQSPPLARATIERIRSMYSGGERAGRFEVRWVTARGARTTRHIDRTS